MDSQWVILEAPAECFSQVAFAEPVPRSQHESHHPRFVFSSIYGYVILHKPAAGLNGEVSGVFSNCFFSLGMRMG